MPTTFNFKITILCYLSVFLFLSSCDKDAGLLYEYALNNDEIVVLDDTFRVPSDRRSILNVLSNDIFTSGKVKIIETSAPSYGDIIINEDNTITYTPGPVTTDEPDEATASEETAANEGTTEEGTSQETDTEDTEQTEEVAEVSNPQEDSSEEAISEEQTSQEVATEAAQVEVEETAEEAAATEEVREEIQVEEEEERTEETPATEEAAEETGQDETSDPEESASEGEATGVIEEDTFTYTTETENEDGTTTTETGTVTVEVETEPEAEPEPETEPVAEPLAELDFWRDPVIAGSRLLDEKYYDLDTGVFYAKEVNLQRGQVENYVEHENCPQHIKDKWADRIEVTPAEVNGSQNGLKTIFEAHPRGSLFYLRAGIYIDQKHAVLKNDQDVVGEYGAILDGSGIQDNSEDATRAIRSLEHGYICNLKVREYPTWNDPQYPDNPRGAALEAIQQGAILNCEVHSHNKAIAINYGSKAMWNKFTAGRLGIHSVGTYDPNDPKRCGTIVKYNEWYDCNFNNYAYGHEAGGSKFVQLDGTIYSHNYIHDNPTGPGIWEDGDNRDSEIYNNVIINTDRSIFSEISHTSNIHHNTIEYGLGFGAIYMSNSQGEKVHHNYVRWCRNGITIRDKERGTSRIYPGQAWRGMNNEIYDNHIWQRSDPTIWTNGVATLYDGHIDPNNTSNQWHDNHYYVDDNAQGAALFSEEVPFTQMFMYIKYAPDTDHWTISWEEWIELSGDTNSTLEYRQFF